MKEALIAPPAILLFSAVKLFAQQPGGGAPTMDANIGSLVGNLGIMGVLVWHLWYVTTRTYPEMLSKFQSETALLRETFNREQAEMRTAFLGEQKALREHNAQMQNELRTVLVQTMQGMRTAVHDVRDTAQATISKVQLISAPPSPESR